MIHAVGSTDPVLQPYGTQPYEVIHSVSRSDLNAILLDRAEATGRVRIEFEQRLERVDFDRSTLALRNARGDLHDVHFDAVFGTDGAGSVVRGAILKANGGVENVAPLDHDYKELTVPPADDGSHRLTTDALHIWPRGEFMLIALANPSGDFTATLFAPNSGAEGFAEMQTPTAVRTFFETQFPAFTEMVPDLEEQFFTNPTGQLATLRLSGWSYENRAVVLGDAAHAIVPFHGQGMNLAMESARALARHLDEQPHDMGTAFVSFEAEQKPNADAIATMALDNYIEMRSGVVDPRYVVKRELALELERRHPDRLSPRYNMVMFSTMPYAEAQARAAAQSHILDALLQDSQVLDDVDFALAAKLVGRMEPLPEIDPLARPDALSVN
jgi:kynurenine 3-monooxygenase